MAGFGYADEILKVDLSDGTIFRIPTIDYVNDYIGGRGLAARLFWEMVPPEVQAYDPENCLIFASGPVAGFPGFAGYRWQVCGSSPLGHREMFSYANLGGKWGVRLKYAGYAGLVVNGKANKPVCLKINNDTVEVLDAAQFWGMSSFETCKTIKSCLGEDYSVLSIGPAAEKKVCFSTMITDDGSSGSGGLGAVMGSKKLKAIAVAGEGKFEAAEPEILRSLAKEIKGLREKSYFLDERWAVPGLSEKEICYGCGLGCARHSYKNEKGERFKSFCQAANVYKLPVLMRTQGKWDDAILLGPRLCDSYGLDSAVMFGLINWLCMCHREGLLSDEFTGLPLSKAGTAEFIEELTRIISLREGFGDLLAEGTISAGESIGGEAEKILPNFVATRGSEAKDYDPRVMPVTSLLYATEPRRPIQQLHEPSIALMMWLKWIRGEDGGFFTSDDFRKAAELFWGGGIAADYTTFEGKALCAKMIQDRTYAKESLVLCDFTFPMIWAKNIKGHVGDPTLESKIFSAITGKKTDEKSLNRMGERIFNLQRAILLRQGWQGKNDDVILEYLYTEPLKPGEVFYDVEGRVPGRDGEAVAKTGTVIDRNEFEKARSEYYILRGWDGESGLPLRSGLEDLQLKYVADDLEKRGLLAQNDFMLE